MPITSARQLIPRDHGSNRQGHASVRELREAVDRHYGRLQPVRRGAAVLRLLKRAALRDAWASLFRG